MNKAYVIFGILFFLSIGIFITNKSQYNLNNQEVSYIQKTQEREKQVAQKLIANHFEQKHFIQKENSVAQERGLASVKDSQVIETVKKSLEGEVAFDPWGHPFKYKVIGSGEPASGSKLLILSSGPNEKMDSDFNKLTSDSADADDIAVVINI